MRVSKSSETGREMEKKRPVLFLLYPDERGAAPIGPSRAWEGASRLVLPARVDLDIGGERRKLFFDETIRRGSPPPVRTRPNASDFGRTSEQRVGPDWVRRIPRDRARVRIENFIPVFVSRSSACRFEFRFGPPPDTRTQGRRQERTRNGRVERGFTCVLLLVQSPSRSLLPFFFFLFHLIAGIIFALHSFVHPSIHSRERTDPREKHTRASEHVVAQTHTWV